MKPLLIHTTDLFHPHGDPDDHYDLAVVFALAVAGKIDVAEIIIDYPPDFRVGDPALLAVEQLNYLTGLKVNVSVEHPYNYLHDNGLKQTGGRLLELLSNADRPAIINVAGRCAGVAAAYKTNPELFKEKCKALYINCGCGADEPGRTKEFNVRLDPTAYAGLFSMDVPIYWCPCFHEIVDGVEFGGEYGTVWKHKISDVMEKLSNGLLNYFLYMYGQLSEHKWLRYLKNEPDRDLFEKVSQDYRRLWCTGGLLHLASIKTESFEFVPVNACADKDGSVKWRHSTDSKQNIFRVKDVEKYPKEMLQILCELFKKL